MNNEAAVKYNLGLCRGPRNDFMSAASFAETASVYLSIENRIYILITAFAP
jgi:hypothetical protein